jgi:predicted DNA-binding transcriptional regulator AlpA
MSTEQSTGLLPRRQVAERYGVNVRTIVRWENDPGLRFPQPLTINKRQYYHEAELTAFDRTRRPASSVA